MRFFVGALAIAVTVLLLASCGNSGDRAAEDRRATLAAHQKEKRVAQIAALEARLRRRDRAEARERKRARRVPASSASSSGLSAVAFSRFAAGQPGKIGVAVDGEVLGEPATGSAWSTIKVPIAAAVLAGGDVSAASRAQMRRAITASDNDAAASLWSTLKAANGGADGAAAAVEKVLAKAGDPSTDVSTVGRDGFSPYGQTDWSLEGQRRFMAGLAAGCVEGGDELLGLMGEVVPDQAWGIGTVGGRFKGGWGPGTDGKYLVRQMGVLDDGAVITMAALPADGALGTGSQMLSDTARWLDSRVKGRPPASC